MRERSPTTNDPGKRLSLLNARNAWNILPILLTGYVLSTLDKLNIGFASLEMNKALGFTASVFGLGAGVFFITYTLFEVPSNLMLRRFGARRWLSRILITWGLISAATALTSGVASFYAFRLALGAAEAGWYPGVLFYLSCWFPRQFRARAITIFWLGAPLSAVLGSPLSGAILTLPPMAGLANWQWLFIVEGVPSVILGIAMLCLLKDTPAQAPWLNRADRELLQDALDRDNAGTANDFAAAGVRSAWIRRVLFFGFVNFLNNICLYGVFIWLPRLIKNFGGLGNFQVGLLAAVPYLFGAIGLAFCGYSSDRLSDRKWHVAVLFFVCSLAMTSASFSASPVIGMACMTVAVMALLGPQGTYFAMVAEALGDSTGKSASLAAGLALVAALGNVGGFAGPYAFGLLLDAFGDFGYALLGVAGLCVVAGVLVASRSQRFLRSDRHRSASAVRTPA